MAEHFSSIGRPTRKAEHYRTIWENAHGPIPKGMVISHLCCAADDTCHGGNSCVHRRCYNLAHLTIETQGDNLRRSKKDPPESQARRRERMANLTPQERAAWGERSRVQMKKVWATTRSHQRA